MDPLSLAPGATIEHFTVLGSVGEGGMGEVVAARDLRLGRVVAIKTIHAGRARTERAAPGSCAKPGSSPTSTIPTSAGSSSTSSARTRISWSWSTSKGGR